jgi:putative intracellular protease/amidase
VACSGSTPSSHLDSATAGAVNTGSHSLASMEGDALARIVDADDFRALTILDIVRSELKRAAAQGGTVASVVDAPALFAALRTRLGRGGGRRPAEEVVLAVVQLLVEFVHVGDKRTIAAIPALLPELVAQVGRDRVRRACGVLLAALLKRLPATASEVTAAVLGSGFASEDVSVRQ